MVAVREPYRGGPLYWWWRYQRSWASNGQDHAATKAAFGRYLAAKGHVAQMPAGQQSDAPTWVAWKRASGADPGYLNRRHRKELQRQQAEHEAEVAAGYHK